MGTAKPSVGIIEPLPSFAPWWTAQAHVSSEARRRTFRRPHLASLAPASEVSGMAREFQSTRIRHPDGTIQETAIAREFPHTKQVGTTTVPVRKAPTTIHINIEDGKSSHSEVERVIVNYRGRPPNPIEMKPVHVETKATIVSAENLGTTTELESNCWASTSQSVAWPKIARIPKNLFESCRCLRSLIFAGNASFTDIDRLNNEMWPGDMGGGAKLGKHIIGKQDATVAELSQASLLYGELTPQGVRKVGSFLNATLEADGVLIDMGMGVGKLAFQAFASYKNLRRVIGIEITPARARQSFVAMRQLYILLEKRSRDCISEDASLPPCPDTTATLGDQKCSLALEQGKTVRTLDYVCGNIFDTPKAVIATASVIIMATDFPVDVWKRIREILDHMRSGARLLTYLHLVPHVFPNERECLRAFKVLRPDSTFATSWSSHALFHLWQKL